MYDVTPPLLERIEILFYYTKPCKDLKTYHPFHNILTAKLDTIWWSTSGFPDHLKVRLADSRVL